MQYLAGVRISGFPALLDLNAINETPASLYVGYEAAVSLKIVVQARSLQVTIINLNIIMILSDLWTRCGEGFISTNARCAGISEQTMASLC